MSRIAFVTTCKNRLHHLQQTLPLWVAEAPDEIVVVDYGCPQGTGDWVEANWPQVKVLRVNDDPGFRLPRARNLGAAAVDADWICFIDADIQVKHGWLAWMRGHLEQGCFYRAAKVGRVRNAETWGTVIAPNEVVRAIGGYDELFTDWGGEDNDLYDRLKLAGVRQCEYPQEFVAPISHDDDMRFVYAAVKTKHDNLRQHNLYRYAKYVWMTVGGIPGDLPLAQRQRLKEQVVGALGGRSGPQETSFSFEIDALGSWLPQDWRSGATCRCEVSLETATRGHRRMRRLRDIWRVLVAKLGGRRASLSGDGQVELHDDLIRPVLRKLFRRTADQGLSHTCTTFLYHMPARQVVRVVCTYSLPGKANP